jgi:hypothetical protein
LEICVLAVPIRRSAVGAALLAALGAVVCALPIACNRTPRAPQPGELLILDADAGQPLEGNERRGVLFRVAVNLDGSYAPPQLYASDERWIEPVDVLLLPDGDALVLEQQWSSEPKPSLGAVFLVRAPPPGGDPTVQASVQLLLTDPRMRQPVSMTRGPDGTLWVSDRQADPLGLGQDTGCVFAFPPVTSGSVPLPGLPGTIAAAGPELLTPGALLRCSDGRLLVMDADANPRGLKTADDRPATPGVLFEITPDGLKELLEPDETVSPIALIERAPGEIYVVDANAGTLPGMLGDGAIFLLVEEDGHRWLNRRLDGALLGRAHMLVDPVGGDTLADGRLIVADANADPLGLGEKDAGFGVYGRGKGAVMAIEPDGTPTATTLIADPAFVTPIAVRRVR